MMTRPFRVRLVLLALASILLAALLGSRAKGQMQPPPPFGPRINGPVIVNVWTCSNCGKELGRGLAVPPDHCPHCHARILNGVGKGISQDGGPIPVPDAGNSVKSADGGMKPSAKKWLLGLVIGIVVVFALALVLGGTFLVIYLVRRNDSAARTRRRRLSDDDDEG